MQSHRDFFPHILFPDDLATMSLAHRDAMAQAGCDDLDPDDVARIAFRFYRMGLVDEKKLADATGHVARHLARHIQAEAILV